MHTSNEQSGRRRSWRFLSRDAVIYCTLDLDGSIRSVEGPIETLFGHVRSDLVGEPRRDLIDLESFATARHQFLAHAAGESEFALNELRILSKMGDHVPVLATSVPARNTHDAIIGVRVMIHAIGDPAVKPSGGGARGETARTVKSLTPRQTEVLTLLSQGASTREIALLLVVTEETARHHIHAILRALEAHSRLEAVIRGLQLGLITVPDF